MLLIRDNLIFGLRPSRSAMPQGPIETATCTSVVLYNPPANGPDCTFTSHTSTHTARVDCSGCALVTRSLHNLAADIVCEKQTTVTTGATTVTACKPSGYEARRAAETTPAPSATCTKLVPGPPFNEDPTCTDFQATATTTSLVECDGCALETLFFGVGPVRLIVPERDKNQGLTRNLQVRICKETVTAPVTTSTTYACRPTGYGS